MPERSIKKSILSLKPRSLNTKPYDPMTHNQTLFEEGLAYALEGPLLGVRSSCTCLQKMRHYCTRPAKAPEAAVRGLQGATFVLVEV